MISKKDHEKLINKWHKIGHVYQRRNKRVIQRLKWLGKHLHLLDGLNVLEVGSNAGLFAVDICKHARYYIGMEKKENYYKQSLITMQKIDNGWFYNIGIEDFCDYDCCRIKGLDTDGIVLSRVLCYLSDKDIKVLKSILGDCKVALVFCRSAKDRKKNSYGFHKMENVAKFFEDQGMKFEVDLIHERYFAGVARKE